MFAKPYKSHPVSSTFSEFGYANNVFFFLSIRASLTCRRLPTQCQMLLFSATYDENVLEFARSIIPDPIEFRVRRNQLTLTNIKQYYLMAPTLNSKYARLSEIYGSFHVGQAIIFCAVSFLLCSEHILRHRDCSSFVMYRQFTQMQSCFSSKAHRRSPFS